MAGLMGPRPGGGGGLRTLQCYPLVLVTEISYLTSVKEVMETLAHRCHRSSDQQLLLLVPLLGVCHHHPHMGIDKLSLSSCQSRVNISPSRPVSGSPIFQENKFELFVKLVNVELRAGQGAVIPVDCGRAGQTTPTRPPTFLSSTEAMMRAPPGCCPGPSPTLLHLISTWSQHYPDT